jgi:NAD(P)-dependent dehydrogenase (short-subunit alcohol dehydrogenase family)
MTLDGKVAVITGGTGNLGQTVTTRFVHAGARVAVAFRSDAEWEALLAALPEGALPLGLKTDVTDEASVQRLMAETVSQLGSVDILLNLVGAYEADVDVWDTPIETWQKMLALNLTSAFLCAKHALRHMVPQDFGRIVSVSSKVAEDLPVKSAPYAVAKAGVIALTKCMAAEVKGTNVAAMAIMPSVIDTPATRKLFPKAPFEKFVKPEQIADVLVWLSTQDAGAVNGSILQLYGGL